MFNATFQGEANNGLKSVGHTAGVSRVKLISLNYLAIKTNHLSSDKWKTKWKALKQTPLGQRESWKWHNYAIGQH